MKLENPKPAYYSIAILIAILLIGFFGYTFIEHYSPINAFYTTIITVTTTGLGLEKPFSPEGKLFTSFLIIFSFVFFAFSITTITRYIVGGVFRNYYKYSKVKKEIDQLNNHVIVVGYGRNGMQAVEELTHHKIPLVVVENREAKVREIQQRDNLLYLDGDPSSDEVLIGAGIKRAKALISVLPTDEENLFVVLTTSELNPKITIISRAINFNTIKKLKTAGASHVIMPDKISGQHMAKMIAKPNIIEFVDYLMLEKSNDVILEEISCKKIIDYQPSTIKQMVDISKESINIIGLRRSDGSYVVNPPQDTLLTCDDQLFVLGKPLEVEQFRKAFKGKTAS
jgi:voltage-gated potassium channel